MRLLEVNGISLLGASHQEAVNSLRTSGDVIHLLICEGYDAVEVERLLSEGKLIREPKSTSESVSSLDRVDFDEPNHFKVTYKRFIIKLFTLTRFLLLCRETRPKRMAHVITPSLKLLELLVLCQRVRCWAIEIPKRRIRYFVQQQVIPIVPYQNIELYISSGFGCCPSS